jgi:cytochrome c1
MIAKTKLLALAFAAALPGPAAAQEAPPAATPPKLSWSFAGPFGTYDPGQLQRG